MRGKYFRVFLSNPAPFRMPTWPVIHKNSGCTDREEVVRVIGNIQYIQPLGAELWMMNRLLGFAGLPQTGGQFL